MTTVPFDTTLPPWMRRATRGTDWGVLLALAFSLIAGWSFALNPGIFQRNANENYIFRAADYARALAEGRLYPRWSPEVLDGYGAPIPHYAPPGAGYIPGAIQLLFTNDPQQAVRAVYVLAFVLAGTATYTFVARRADAAAGLIASVLYVFSPYLALTAPHLLGDLPGVMGLALLPALLWSADRYALATAPPDVLLITLTSGLLLMTEPRLLAAGSVLTLIWLIVVERRPRAVIVPALGIALGVCIGAIFWLPALLEWDAVRWVERASDPRPPFDPRELVRPLARLDPAALRPTPQFTLGAASLAAALASLPVIARRGPALHRVFLLFSLIIFAVLFNYPSETWLIGVAAFTLAVTGSAVAWRSAFPARFRRLALPLVLLMVTALSFPAWLPPRAAAASFDASPAAQRRYEELGYGIAVLSPDAPLPTTLPEAGVLMMRDDEKIAQFTDGERLGVLEHQSHADIFQIPLAHPDTLHVLTTYFPGWTAAFQGEALPVEPHPNGGLLIRMFAGAYGELVVALDLTPPRLIGAVVTGAALATLLAITLWRYRRRRDSYHEVDHLTLVEARLCAVLLIGLGGAVALFSTGVVDARPGYQLADAMAIQARTDTGLELLAYDLHHEERQATLNLYWRAVNALPENYRVVITIRAQISGAAILQADPRSPGGYPTGRWQENLYVTDTYHFDVPMSGDYLATVEVLRPTGTRLSFFAPDASEVGEELLIPLRAE